MKRKRNENPRDRRSTTGTENDPTSSDVDAFRDYNEPSSDVGAASASVEGPAAYGNRPQEQRIIDLTHEVALMMSVIRILASRVSMQGDYILQIWEQVQERRFVGQDIDRDHLGELVGSGPLLRAILETRSMVGHSASGHPHEDFLLATRDIVRRSHDVLGHVMEMLQSLSVSTGGAREYSGDQTDQPRSTVLAGESVTSRLATY